MNKVLVTGYAIGLDVGPCQVCNYDLDWLIDYPSVLLWADKILVPKTIWDVIQQEKHPRENSVAKSCKLIFDVAKEAGIVEIVEPSTIVTESLCDSIDMQIAEDVDNFRRLFPDKVHTKSLAKPGADGPVETVIDGMGYCDVYLWSIYASLILARTWGVNCLFNNNTIHYLRYKFAMTAKPDGINLDRAQSFTTVFQNYLPNDPIIPYYALHSEGKCTQCKREKECNDSYLLDVEKRVRELLRWRDYDEILQAKDVLESIVASRDSHDGISDPKEIAKAFHEKQSKILKCTRLVFPKAKRWANIATIISIPIAVAGIASSSPLVTLSGAATAGIAQIGKEYLQYLESKYRWVGFLSSIPNLCDKQLDA
ncbi:MAG: hypothetical protein WC374_12305 [Phycisphaerae bacterium]|jgi:hypothetical protein